MRVETALKLRDSIISEYRSHFSRAKRLGLTQAELLDARGKQLDRLIKAPGWVRQYVSGYWYALSDMIHQSDLIHGGFIHGRFYSTHPERADYYGKNDIDPRNYEPKQAGFYWKDFVDKGEPRPYFTSDITSDNIRS